MHYATALLFAAGLATFAAAQSVPAPQPANQPATAMTMVHKPIPAPTGPLKITYRDKTLELSPAELAALPHQAVDAVGEHAKTPLHFSGILLIDLLTRAGVPAKTHGAGPRSYVVVEATDGYKTVYSLAEVNPAFRDTPVLLADAEDGKPLPYLLRIVAAGEKDEARWVRGVAAIRVVTVE